MAKGDIKVEKKDTIKTLFKEYELLLPTGEHEKNGEAILAKKEILPTKLKYMVGNKDYMIYQLLEQIGVFELLSCSDGHDLIKTFLISVFNNKEYVESIIDDLDVDMIVDIVQVSKKRNKIKEEDELKKVLTNLAKEGSQ